VAVNLLTGASDGLAGFLDPVPPAGLVNEREGGTGPLAFQFGGAEGVGAYDPDRCRPECAGGGAVMPVGDGQIRQRDAGIADQADGLVQQREAPDRPTAVQDARGFPFDVGLGEDGFDDLAHLSVVDDGIGVLVYGKNRTSVGPRDGFPASDRLVVGGEIVAVV